MTVQKNPSFVLFLLVCLLGIENLFAFEESEIQHEVPAVEKIRYVPDMVWKPTRVGDDAETYTWKVVSVEGDIVTIESDGCSQTLSLLMPFSPPLSWENCGPGSGSHIIRKTKGTVFPLHKGTRFQHTATGRSSSGESWKTVRKCKVEKKVAVIVPMGNFDTWKLVCDESRFTHTYWISPELEFWVAYEQTRKGCCTELFEYSSITRPQ